ncbi:MAG: peptide deformylase [Candidatus Bostrichicola ureolyticus]|nr:MAG: peptide deformylase [Candidatus Bostrichicola ureolyticus]
MILPIIIYGKSILNNSILRKKCVNISNSFPKLNLLISNMFDTMYNVKGIGLAAPQIGKNIKLFIVDMLYVLKHNQLSYSNYNNYKKVFINAKIIKSFGKTVVFKEGCLSIPNIIELVKRKSHILIRYYDEYWNIHTEILNGLQARIVQHEYDHIDGKLFIDRLSTFKKKNIYKKLFI